MIGKILPRTTDLKSGKMVNTINLDISSENPASLFEETINKLEVYNLNQQNKFENRTRIISNLHAEQENELKSKAIFDFNNNINNNSNEESKKIVYRIINNNEFKNNKDDIEIENNYNQNNTHTQNQNKNIYNSNNINDNDNENNDNNLNSNLDGSFGFSKNSVLTSINPPLNLHNRVISDNSNFNLNDFVEDNKNNKEIILEKQSKLTENNIFLNNLIKQNNINNNNNNINNNNLSSRNDFAKDEKIISFLFSVIDSKFSFGIFKKFNLNFYDFLNVTKDELTEFKVPIKEKIRLLKLNLNLKKFLEENISEADFTAFTQNTSDVNNLNLIFEFFKQNKFLVYNQKFLDGFFTNKNFIIQNKIEQQEEEEYLNNNFISKINKNVNANLNNNNNNNHNNAHEDYGNNLVDNNVNTDDENNLESNYVTTPNFRNISHRKNNGNISNNNNATYKNNLPSINHNNNYYNIDISSNNPIAKEHPNNNNDFLYNPKSNTILDNYNNNRNRNVIYISNRNNNSNNTNLGGNHEKEIIELLKNKEHKNNTISAEPAYSAKKFNLNQSNALKNVNKNNKENKVFSHYESFRNEYEKIKGLNDEYKEVYSNSNSFVGDKVSEIANDPYSKSFMNEENINKNFNFSESGNTFTNKIKSAADNSSIKMHNHESNKDLTTFKISNFSIKSKNNNNYNNNIINNKVYNNENNNNNNNEEFEIYDNEQEENQTKQDNSNFLNQDGQKIQQNKINKGSFKKEKSNTNNNQLVEKLEILENHENLQKQKKLLDKIVENKTKSKIKFKKNSTRYFKNSNEISKIVNNYLSEYKELKQRSENRQMQFNRILKNCNRTQNKKSNMDSNYCVEAGTFTEKTNTDDREELLLNKELNDLLVELKIYSENFKVSEDNIYKLKRIKEIIDALKARNVNFEFDLDFNVEELEKQIELEKIEKVEQRKLKIAEEIKKCDFNINEKKKILDILQQDSVRNNNKSNELLDRIKQINSNKSFKNNLTQQSKALTVNYESSKYSEKTNTGNKEQTDFDNEENYDYENEDLNQHIEQSSYDENYDSKNYSVHNFQKDN